MVGNLRTIGTENVWEPKEYGMQWLNTCQTFMDLLYTILFIGGGGPPRGSELAHIRVQNTATAHRNILLYKGRVCSLTTYSKGRNRGC